MTDQKKTPPRKTGKVAAIILIMLFIAFAVFASTVPLAKGVVAMGTVVVDSKRKTIQHFEGGVIKLIHVSEASPVSKDEVLIELDDTTARVERDLIRSRYFMKLAVLDRLLALQSGLKTISFREILLQENDEPQIKELFATQLNLFKVLRNEQKGKKSILQQRVQQLTEKSKGLRAYKKSIQQQSNILGKDIRRLGGLVKKGLIESSMVIERQQLFTQLQGDLGKTLAAISETQAASSEAKLNIVQVDKESQQQLALEIAETQEAVIELKNQLLASENVLERTLIKAPQAGTVFGLQYHTVGGVIASGKPIMDIVPQGGKIIVEAKIRPLDIDAIKVGMMAKIQLSSFSAKKIPSLMALLEHASADTMAGNTGEEAFYIARLSVSEAEREKLNGLQVLPGMPVEIYFDGGSRTMVEYLFDPLSSAFKRSMRED